ncbi:MAG: hypothetical protein QME94_09735 [Anaerolineae bacterium]|nr:hypothetical protein [Anaerolineae bacterium]
MYLAEYVGLDTANPLVVLDPADGLRTEAGEEGAFCLPAVPPGTYALIVWNAVESVLLDDPETGYSLAIDVTSDAVVDVGMIYTPIP